MGSRKSKDNIETISALKKIFPNKELVYFYELDSLISAWCNGTLLRFDDLGNIEPSSENDIKNQKYYNHKYVRFVNEENLIFLRKKWTTETNETLREKYLTEWNRSESEYVFKYHNLLDVFIDIGKNSVCYPYCFSDNTAEWSRKEYGKLIDYAHAGEIFFVQTKDRIFFEIKRHY